MFIEVEYLKKNKLYSTSEIQKNLLEALADSKVNRPDSDMISSMFRA